ncbi:beta-ketoacyl-ACP synthase [Moritella marina ATCC 15381]|uniref:Beta-ketoacyl-ACP synthase n=1 Tax=Moritella marina ATCC 15381 TaxID=1202962 RepID=A0A5J6WG94_MORMI|nr:beta-ketoacyl-ACP synthase [Moritella marina]QFI37009.1 beta-ketoacyl-ACP synthase [Moritella marina ATCC 15381]
MRRVVVTGMSAITALGDDWATFKAGLEKGKNAVKVMPEWDYLDGLNTRLAAPVTHFEKPKHYKRKQVRSMGRVSLMSTRATELALEQAQLLDHPALTDGSTGISYGSSVGSTEPLINFSRMMDTGNMSGVTATSYIQTMSHTAPVNVGVFFGLTGRVITTSSACTSGSQGIGYAYEAIKFGRQDLMVAGGAEELCITEAAVFDTLYATSVKNDMPALTPRPFDKDRDGLVIGEGACTLILEELEHALERGATIYAEIVGFGCNSDGKHVTQPTAETMQVAIEQAVKDANIDIADIGYVCAHGTATDRGDIAETNATANALGRKPISSLKSYLGHTLGACGAIEAWASINMMQDNWFAPTINLDSIAEECGDLDYIRGEGREIHTDVVMSNNFAFGGINTSLLFKRWQS